MQRDESDLEGCARVTNYRCQTRRYFPPDQYAATKKTPPWFVIARSRASATHVQDTETPEPVMDAELKIDKFSGGGRNRVHAGVSAQQKHKRLLLNVARIRQRSFFSGPKKCTLMPPAVPSTQTPPPHTDSCKKVPNIVV